LREGSRPHKKFEHEWAAAKKRKPAEFGVHFCTGPAGVMANPLTEITSPSKWI
jgi:hypothetical protein